MIFSNLGWSEAEHVVAEAIGKPCPAWVFANYEDEGYGRFLLDAKSEAALMPDVPNPDPLTHSMLWASLWDNVRFARTAPRAFVELALKNLPADEKSSDEAFVRQQGGRVSTALHSYVTPVARQQLVPAAEAAFFDSMLNNPDLGLRIVSFRTFYGIAETPAALGQVKQLLAGSLTVPGLTLKPLDRWSLIAHLVAMGDPEASALLAAEKAHDRSGEGQRYAYATEAAVGTAAGKARYFDEYLHSTSIQEDWITQSLRPFNAWNQARLTGSYLTPALNELPEIKQHRKIFFLGAWLSAFVEGQNTLESAPAAQTAIRQWLGGKEIDPDLRLKVLEAADDLDRTVLIGARFPE